jgi:hypothetical protein
MMLACQPYDDAAPRNVSATPPGSSTWHNDLLPGGLEQVIAAGSSLDETVRRIMADAGLGRSQET